MLLNRRRYSFLSSKRHEGESGWQETADAQGWSTTKRNIVSRIVDVLYEVYAQQCQYMTSYRLA